MGNKRASPCTAEIQTKAAKNNNPFLFSISAIFNRKMMPRSGDHDNKPEDTNTRMTESGWKCNTTLIRGSELLISNNTFLADGSIVAYNIRLGFIEAVWMLGVIDEIQMPMKETDRNPILVD